MFGSFKLARQASPASPPSPAPAGFGKSGHGGVSATLGPGTSGAPRVGLVTLSLKDIGTSNVCGGVIGKVSNRMCILANCTIQAHSQNKHTFEDLGQTEGPSCVFIRSKGTDAGQAFASPAIGTHRFVNLDRYLGELRTVDQWEFLFESLSTSQGEDQKMSPGELDVWEAKAAQAAETSKTPLKKRAKLVDFSPRSETGFESTWIPMDPLDTDFRNSPMALESTVRDLVSNLDTLRSMTDGVKVTQMQVGERVEDELSDLDLQIASLRRVLGTRPVEMGTLTVFDAIKQLKAQGAMMDGDRYLTGQCARSNLFMNTILDQVWRPTNAKSIEFKADIVTELEQVLAPMKTLFSVLSHQRPGDQFEELGRRVADLDKKIGGGPSNFGSGVGNLGGPNGLSWGNTSQGPSLGPFKDIQDLVSDYLTVKLELGNTKQKLKEMEDRMAGGAVRMVGVAFRSWSETTAWLSANLGTDAKFYTLFMDAHGFMALAFQEQANGSEHVTFKSSVAKAGYDSTQEALISGSFVSELPAFFGWDKKHEALTGDSRVLPGMKKYSDWDSGSSYNGLRFRMAEKITEATARLTAQANAVLGPAAANVAVAMISESANFLNRLSEWITREYTDLVTRGGDKEATWKLISHSVRTVFNDIHRARSFGQDSDEKPDRPGRIMWASLQGHKKMKEYLDENFSRHPKISFILNVHIRDNMISKGQFQKLQDQVAAAVAAATAASSNADRAVSLANNGKQGGRGGGGGGFKGKGKKGTPPPTDAGNTPMEEES